MICFHHFIIVPLLFTCISQFVSACNVSGSDSKNVQPGLPADPGTVQVSETAAPVQDPEKPKPVQVRDDDAEPEKTKPVQEKKAVWVGDVNPEDPLASAADIYSKSPSNPPGVYEYQGLVFCIVSIPLSRGNDWELDDDFSYEMYGMLEEGKQIRNRYNLSSVSRLPRRVLENQMGETCYRYATVYRLKDIQALQAVGKIASSENEKGKENEMKKENEKEMEKENEKEMEKENEMKTEEKKD